MQGFVKALLSACFCFLLAVPAFADQRTTVLTQNVTIGSAKAAIPYIDGNLAVDTEKMANNIIAEKCKGVLKRFGNKGELSYTITLNRPSIVSVLLRGSYDGRTIYEGVNVDLTSGKEFNVNEFFVNSDRIKATFDKTESILFAEKGIYKRSRSGENYESFVPYRAILPDLRIGEAGRIMQIARLTRNAEGKVLRVSEGSVFAMKLDCNPSTGYGWSLKQTEAIKGNIVKIGSSFVMPSANDTRVGTPGTDISMYAVGAAGVYDICMEYKRPWETYVQQKLQFKLIVEE